MEERVLSSVKPTAEETKRIESAVSTLLLKINDYASARLSSLRIEPLLVGSVSKGTFMRNPDVDIFIRFPASLPRKDLEKKGVEIGMAVLDEPFLKYAEHPYVRGKYKGIAIDLVPCYSISDSARKMSAVDRTPFHTEFINRYMNDLEKDQVRLLKQFFKGIGVYGAEARTHGFSGYLCELLILSYGSFIAVVEKGCGWTYRTVIVPPHAKLGEKLKETDSCLIVPDPVDNERNVAAALEKDSFALAVLAFRQYSARPGLNFFFPGKVRRRSLSEIRKYIEESGHGLVVLRLPRPDIIDDNLYPQISKAVKNLTRFLEEYGFEVNRTQAAADTEVRFAFEMKHRNHPSMWLREGPYGWSPNSVNFIEKHRKNGADVFISDGRLYSETGREFRTPVELLSKMIGSVSLGADIDGLKKKIIIESDSEAVTIENLEVLSGLLFHTFPWERDAS
ncbi:MAG: CCA tRNA nucleotidyltransferase [Thermoplasmata archaeon]|uniref:CCA-adding enzyme n=1 Tax=Candidatus Sysuiplasma superficiale TaxID=2823368 RepID=A0A8J7YNH8_9ARCH|nr:CCA tRNA nucleotidyltransferase [Candidatus Sysuiplasma superficiale]MBX8644231.1 CCA tRNA nucleotidyltransferase [Candidatus Sysuiplasma superficiale]MCL4346372.1 CCA tRNA nucleotidyltransferase [Candidatus Thermoplasmatota archaeon]